MDDIQAALRLLETLPRRTKVVFLLRSFRFPIADIALELGISTRRVHAHLATARRRLGARA